MTESEFQVPKPHLNAYRRSSLLFGVSGGLLLFAVLTSFALQQGWFQRQFHVRVVAPNSSGLAVGTPVQLSGLRVGRLQRISLLPDGQVRLLLQIPARYKAWITPKSSARITSESAFSKSSIDLLPAPMNPSRVPDQFQVSYSRAAGFDDFILGAEETRKELNSLLRSTQRIADKELPATLKEIQAVVASSNALAGVINRELPVTTAELRASLRKAGRTSDEVERTLAELRPSLQTSLTEFSQLMQRSNALLKSLQGLLEPIAPVKANPGPNNDL